MELELWKLTDENARTFRSTQWGPGVTHEGMGVGDLCGPGWIHAYVDPLLALLLNPIHAAFQNPRLWRAEGRLPFRDDHGLKCGVFSLTTIEEVPLPVVTTEQRVRFGILCATQVYTEPSWRTWADRWLSGADRTIEEAEETAKRSAALSALTARSEKAERSAVAAIGAAVMEEPSASKAAALAATWAAMELSGIDLIAIAREAVA